MADRTRLVVPNNNNDRMDGRIHHFAQHTLTNGDIGGVTLRLSNLSNSSSRGDGVTLRARLSPFLGERRPLCASRPSHPGKPPALSPGPLLLLAAVDEYVDHASDVQ